MATLQELLGSPDAAGVWNLDSDRSTITFRAKSMWGLMPVKGTFNEFSGDGQVTGDGEVTGGGAVFGRVDIRADSLRTGIKMRDRHLRSADFFDVEKFPDISIVVTAAEPSGEDGARLRASVTVKGTTLPIELPATVRVLDDGAARVTTQATVDRSQFDVGGNLLGMVTKPVTISCDLVFTRATN